MDLKLVERCYLPRSSMNVHVRRRVVLESATATSHSVTIAVGIPRF